MRAVSTFPNRLHAVRVAAKKLRYSAELAGKGGLWQCEDAVADLKRTQETLGRLHDAEVLLKAVDELVGKTNGGRSRTRHAQG